MPNQYICRLEREKLNVQITEFFAQGNEVKQLGNQMRKDSLPYVVNPKKHFGSEKLPPSFERDGLREKT